ncbi:sporulation transcriptional regulator SpoIIID [Acetobacter nitrogenifigens]|uniref:sporulation transcriptional regulator SpoIIID n=1 Tax=Acetobacter nitrogenifigens TaxID=285268 RepID=UPI0011BDB9A3|nr:sporulation transcriptional regulator SpoIIID [Acetobacter nitrogenifigens]
MPRALIWSAELDEKLTHLVNNKKMTIRNAAKFLGVSRSFIHRRCQMLQRETNFRSCSVERERAGFEPLAAGHPISWLAIQIQRPIRVPPNQNSYHARAA